MRTNGLSLAETASRSLTSLFSLTDRVSPRLRGFKEWGSSKTNLQRSETSSATGDDIFYDCGETTEYPIVETGLVEIETAKRFYVTSVTSGERTWHGNNFEKARNIFQSGTLLESMEKHEKNIFYNVRDDDDMQYACLKESLYCSTSMYEELNCFAPVLLPTNKNFCVLIQTFRWREVKESDYFVNNWSVLSGIGNILLFSTKYFQVGQVSFLRILSTDAAKRGGKEKEDNCPTFIIMTEVYYEDNLLNTLLQFIQRTRVGRNTGHLGIYSRNEIGN